MLNGRSSWLSDVLLDTACPKQKKKMALCCGKQTATIKILWFVAVLVIVIVASVVGAILASSQQEDENKEKGDGSSSNQGQPGWHPMGTDLGGQDAFAEWGRTVALSANGTTLLVGGLNERVVLYNFAQGHWHVEKILLPQHQNEFAGVSLAMSSDATVIALGSNNENINRSSIIDTTTTNNNNNLFLAGKTVTLQQRNTGTYNIVTNLPLVGQEDYERFGSAVALSSNGNVMAVGGPFAQSERGIVRMYRFRPFPDLVWNQETSFPGEMPGDRLGSSIAMASNGNLLAIGAPQHDGDQPPKSGLVRFFQYDTAQGVWTRGNDLKGQESNELFGSAVALSGDGIIVAVGSVLDGFRANGLTRIYKSLPTSNGWTQLGSTIVGEPSEPGQDAAVQKIALSLSSDGSMVAIGYGETDQQSLIGTGKVRVYQYESDQEDWELVGKEIDRPSSISKTRLWAESVSLSKDGRIVAIGAPQNTLDKSKPQSGLVQVFVFKD